MNLLNNGLRDRFFLEHKLIIVGMIKQSLKGKLVKQQQVNIGESETTTVILDGDWLRIVETCLDMVSITMNQYDKSSAAFKRPEATVQAIGAVCLLNTVWRT